MKLSFDHAVIVVPALADAVRRYTAAGFIVTPGGRHDALPTENALIGLADGSYLELLALRDDDARESLRLLRQGRGWAAHLRESSAIGRRFLPRLAGSPGVADFVLCGENLERFARESRRRGFVMTGPVAMSRARPDGDVLAWELLLPEADHLPFLIADRTPRAQRVPAGAAATHHPNGARGVVGVEVRVENVPAVALEYADLFGATPRMTANGTTSVEIGALQVTLAAGAPAGACGIVLAGVAALPENLIVDGLRCA